MCLHKLGPSFHLVFLFTCIYAFMLHVISCIDIHFLPRPTSLKSREIPRNENHLPLYAFLANDAVCCLSTDWTHWLSLCICLWCTFFNLKKKLHGDLECLEMCYTTFNLKWLLMFLKSVIIEKQNNSVKK